MWGPRVRVSFLLERISLAEAYACRRFEIVGTWVNVGPFDFAEIFRIPKLPSFCWVVLGIRGKGKIDFKLPTTRNVPRKFWGWERVHVFARKVWWLVFFCVERYDDDNTTPLIK